MPEIKYPPTEEQREAMIRQQGGKCAICSRRGVDLVADHDHDTGNMRGMLCYQCNSGIGMLGDSPYRLMMAANYIAPLMRGIRRFRGHAEVKRSLCEGSYAPPSRIGPITRGPGLFRCQTCDRSDVKVRKLGMYRHEAYYITLEHYRPGEEPRRRGPRFTVPELLG